MSTHGPSDPSSLTTEFLLDKYSCGFYPEGYTEDGRLIWKSPDWRAVVPIESYRIPKHARRAARQANFVLKVDTAFEHVIRACASRKNTWISEEIIQVYCELHRAGYAHSIEAWQGDVLSGGLYGVVLGAAWFAESMFHIESNASKVAVLAELKILQEYDFRLSDSQVLGPFIKQFGAYLIPRDKFLDELASAVKESAGWPESGTVVEFNV